MFGLRKAKVSEPTFVQEVKKRTNISGYLPCTNHYTYK